MPCGPEGIRQAVQRDFQEEPGPCGQVGQFHTGARDAQGEGLCVTQSKVVSPTVSVPWGPQSSGRGRGWKKVCPGRTPELQGRSALATVGLGVGVAKASGEGKRVVLKGLAQEDQEVRVQREGQRAGVVAGLLEVTWGLRPWGPRKG